MRFREENSAELQRARAAVAAWRDQHPAGTAEDLVIAIGHQFRQDYSIALRAVLFAADRHRAREITGAGTGNVAAGRARS